MEFSDRWKLFIALCWKLNDLHCKFCRTPTESVHRIPSVFRAFKLFLLIKCILFKKISWNIENFQRWKPSLHNLLACWSVSDFKLTKTCKASEAFIIWAEKNNLFWCKKIWTSKSEVTAFSRYVNLVRTRKKRTLLKYFRVATKLQTTMFWSAGYRHTSSNDPARWAHHFAAQWLWNRSD